MPGKDSCSKFSEPHSSLISLDAFCLTSQLRLAAPCGAGRHVSCPSPAPPTTTKPGSWRFITTARRQDDTRGVTYWIRREGWDGGAFPQAKSKPDRHLTSSPSSVSSVGHLDTDATGSPMRSRSRSLGSWGFHLSGLGESWPVPV